MSTPRPPTEPSSADARSRPAVAARAFVEHVETELAGGRLPPQLQRDMKRFLAMPWNRQRDELPALYLGIEEYLADIAEGRRFTRAHLRGMVRSRWRALVELPELAVVLASPEEQERRLVALFVDRLAVEARPVIGDVARVGEPRDDIAAVVAAVERTCGATVAERLVAATIAGLAGVYRGLESAVLEVVPLHLLDSDALHKLSHRRREHAASERFAALRRVHDEVADRLCDLEREHSEVLSTRRSSSQSTALYGALLETADEGVLAVDRAGIVHRANAAALAMWGASTAAELVGLDLKALLPGNGVPMQRLRHYLKTGTPSVFGDRLILDARRRDGATFPVGVRASETHVGEHPVYTLVVRDLGEQRRAEAELRLQAAALSSSIEAIAITDPAGIVEWVNPAFTGSTGLSLGELGGATLAQRCGLEDDPAAAPWRGERTLRRADGSTYVARVVASPVRDDDDRVLHVVVHHEDISAQRHAQSALERSELDLRALIERAPEAIFVVRAGRVRLLNQQAATYLGHADRAALIDRPFAELVGADDSRALVAALRATEERGDPIAAREVTLVQHGGATLAAEIIGLAITLDGAPVALLFARDITERKRMQEKLAVADRMVALGTLAAGVAHEINNPLTYVMVNLEALGDALGKLATRPTDPPPGAPSLARLAEQAREALEGADRVRLIVRDLHTFAQDESATPTASDVQLALDACVQMARTQLRHRARVIKVYGPTPLVPASETRLRQVFLNLIINAAQSIAPGDAPRQRIELCTRTDESGRAEVTISDTGCGIASDIRHRVFDPFFTTRRVGEGMGLGLSIAHTIVVALGGELELDSAAGGGTRVRITLPRAARPGAPGASASTSEGTTRRARILVVDDEVTLGRSIQRILGRDHEVTSALSGRAALDILAEDDPFDVILCDFMMPDMTGVALYEEIERERPELAPRIAFMTGGDFTGMGRDLLARIPNRVLEKPFPAADLVALVKAMLG